MKSYTKRFTNFKQGMTPNLYGNGLARVEHFDVVSEQARPFNALALSTTGGLGGDAVSVLALSKMAMGSNVLYALGVDDTNATFPAIYSWGYNDADWRTKLTSATGRTAAPILLYYLGSLYGLHGNLGGRLWKMTTAGTYTDAFQTLAYTNTPTADPIVHSKNGIAYIFSDNNVASFDGTTVTQASLALSSMSRIASGAEHGDYVSIVANNTESGMATLFMWDKSSSLNTLSEKYSLGTETVYHNASLNNTMFTVSARLDGTQTNFVERPVLVIKYLSGGAMRTVMELECESLNLASQGKHVTADRLYFHGVVKLKGDATAKNVVFCLDYAGNLTISTDASVNTNTSGTVSGIFRDTGSMWLVGQAQGSWNTTSGFATTSTIETTKCRAEDMTKSLDFVGAVVTFEALPSGAVVYLDSRANESATWVTLATFDTDNAVKGSVTKDGCATMPSIAKERQFRVRSTGGSVITGLQIDMVEVPDESYG